MSDERFELTKINPTVNLYDTVYFIIDYDNPNKEIRTLKDCVGLLNEQQATIEMYQRRVNKREEQISIIKKYCLKFLTDEQFETIRKGLENE